MIRIARLLLSCDPWDCQHTTEDTDAAKSGSPTYPVLDTVSWSGRGEQSGVRGRQHGAGETPSQSLVTGNGQSGHGRGKGRKCLGFSLSTHFYPISRLFIIFSKSQTLEKSPLPIYSINIQFNCTYLYLKHKQKCAN